MQKDAYAVVSSRENDSSQKTGEVEFENPVRPVTSNIYIAQVSVA